MKVKVDREKLLPHIQQLNSVVDPKHETVLSMLLFEAGEDGLFITATDNYRELRLKVEGAEVKEEGTCCVPCKKLYDICRAVAKETKFTFTLKDGKLKLVSTGSSRKQFTLATLPTDTFPVMPELPEEELTETLNVDIKSFINAMKEISFSMAVEDTRFYLNGMLFSLGGDSIELVTSDGNRLSMYKQDLGQGLESIKDAIIPNTSVEIMIKLLGKAKDIWGLSFSERGFQIGVKDTWRYKGKLIDGKYLDYKRVVPEENSKEVVFDREAVLESFKCANLLVNKSEPMMAMTLVPGEMTLSGVNAKYEKFEESIEVDYAGESLELGVNVTYLMEVFSALNTEQVVMQLESFNSPILIFGKGNTHTRYVVMPMNLMQN